MIPLRRRHVGSLLGTVVTAEDCTIPSTHCESSSSISISSLYPLDNQSTFSRRRRKRRDGCMTSSSRVWFDVIFYKVRRPIFQVIFAGTILFAIVAVTTTNSHFFKSGSLEVPRITHDSLATKDMISSDGSGAGTRELLLAPSTQANERFVEGVSKTPPHQSRRRQHDPHVEPGLANDLPPINVSFLPFATPTIPIHENINAEELASPNFGGIRFSSTLHKLQEKKTTAKGSSSSSSTSSLPLINIHQDAMLYNALRAKQLEDIDSPRIHGHLEKFELEEDLPVPRECYRPNWYSLQFPTCNNVHEHATLDRAFPASTTAMSLDPSITTTKTTTHRNDDTQNIHNSQHAAINHKSDILQEYETTYRGAGYWRVAWLFAKSPKHRFADSFVWKSLNYDDENSDYNFDNAAFFNIQRDALIQERLTASPRVVDVYGFCGTSMFVEHMKGDLTREMVGGNAGYMSSKELDSLQDEDVHPMNDLEPMEKLDIAIDMAEAVAELHGFEGGVFLHGDIHHEQWLYSHSGEIKINDFNNGDILEFSTDANGYCTVYRDFHGSYRSPEELRYDFVDEKMDVYSYGHQIYTLLTGLLPFYQYDEEWEGLYPQIAENQLRPFVDPRYRKRSRIESGLVDVMELCWEFNPVKRPSIFDVRALLLELKEEVLLANYENE